MNVCQKPLWLSTCFLILLCGFFIASYCVSTLGPRSQTAYVLGYFILFFPYLVLAGLLVFFRRLTISVIALCLLVSFVVFDLWVNAMALRDDDAQLALAFIFSSFWKVVGAVLVVLIAWAFLLWRDGRGYENRST